MKVGLVGVGELGLAIGTNMLTANVPPTRKGLGFNGDIVVCIGVAIKQSIIEASERISSGVQELSD